MSRGSQIKRKERTSLQREGFGTDTARVRIDGFRINRFRADVRRAEIQGDPLMIALIAALLLAGVVAVVAVMAMAAVASEAITRPPPPAAGVLAGEGHR